MGGWAMKHVFVECEGFTWVGLGGQCECSEKGV